MSGTRAPTAVCLLIGMLCVPVAVRADKSGGPQPSPRPPSKRKAPAPLPETRPQALLLPLPERLPEGDCLRIGNAPDWYRGDDRYIRPFFRVAPGFSGRIGGKPIPGFSLDLQGTLMFGLTPGKAQWGLGPEIGYSLRAPGVEHQLTVGAAVMYGVSLESFSVAWVPRFVLGSSPDGLALGARNGVLWDFAENGFAVELSYELTQRGDQLVHDIRFTVSIDLAALIYVLGDIKAKWR